MKTFTISKDCILENDALTIDRIIDGFFNEFTKSSETYFNVLQADPYRIPEEDFRFLMTTESGELVHRRIIIVLNFEKSCLIVIKLFPNCRTIKYRLLLEVAVQQFESAELHIMYKQLK